MVHQSRVKRLCPCCGSRVDDDPVKAWVLVEYKSESANADGTRYSRTNRVLRRFNTYSNAKRECDRLNDRVEQAKAYDQRLRNGWISRHYEVELRRDHVPGVIKT